MPGLNWATLAGTVVLSFMWFLLIQQVSSGFFTWKGKEGTCKALWKGLEYTQ
jgi:hypothetical protein